MEKACELALQGKKLYQAAEEVGIPDAGYFGKCFKKYKNITYTEYVKEGRNLSDSHS